jgi:hypothetical protein
MYQLIHLVSEYTCILKTFDIIVLLAFILHGLELVPQ